MFEVLAIIPVYNEMDILPYTVNHLLNQELNIHILDNWSTDNIKDTFRYDNYITCERWPCEGPSKYFEWNNILQKVEQISQSNKNTWIMLNDADELRYSDIPNESLYDAFKRVDELGYNAVDFETNHFKFNEDFIGDFNVFSLDRKDNIKQIKAWKNTGQKIDLHSSGGHDVKFDRRKVYPNKFILDHYPFRSKEQMRRKLLEERVGRYSPSDLAKGFHTHYMQLAKELNAKN